jgi:hypothetical protein
MQIANLFLTTLLSLSNAGIIPATTRGSSSPTMSLRDAYNSRRALAMVDINTVFEPQNFAKIQTDRRKAFGESP